MQIKKFQANNMTEALESVKREFGYDAVILSARKVKGKGRINNLLGKNLVEVTAATDAKMTGSSHNAIRNMPLMAQGDCLNPSIFNKLIKSMVLRDMNAYPTRLWAKIKPFISYGKSSKNINFETSSIFNLMLSQGIERDIASKLSNKLENRLKSLSSDDILNHEIIKTNMITVFQDNGIKISPINLVNGKQTVVTLIGSSAVGKTTAAVKLAAIYAKQMNKKVALISIDKLRIGSIEQLKIYGKIIGIPIETASNNNELKCCLKKLKNKDIVIIDTYGISYKNNVQINDLKRYFHKIGPFESHLVLNATTKTHELSNIVDSLKSIKIDKLLFTNIDECCTFGSIINLLMKTNIPVSYFSVSQEIPEGIEMPTLENMVDMIVESRKVSHDTPAVRVISDSEKSLMNNTTKGRFKYIVNKNTGIFHLSECKFANRITAENGVWLNSSKDALDTGFKPCKRCNHLKQDTAVFSNEPDKMSMSLP